MPIIQIIVVLVVIGVVLWLVNTYIPMPDPYKKVLNVIIIVLVILWILNIVGVFGSHVRIGRM